MTWPTTLGGESILVVATTSAIDFSGRADGFSRPRHSFMSLAVSQYLYNNKALSKASLS